MDENTQVVNTATQSKSKIKLISIITLICIIATSAWYFVYYTKTPEYSLGLIKESVEKHDVAKFNKHVDLDSILSRGYDDLFSAMIESDKSMSSQGKSFIAGFAQMFKATFINGFKDNIKRYVETGSWEEKQSQDDTSKNAQSNKSPDKISSSTSNLKKSDFKGIAYTKKDGKVATIGLKLYDKDINKESILDVKMRELDDGTWQVAELANLKEYILSIENEKNEQLRKYISDIQPIIDKSELKLDESNRKFDELAPVIGKEAAMKQLINSEIIPNWNSRMEELIAIPTPAAAKELSELRIKVCQLRLQQYSKMNEWLETKNHQTYKEVGNIVAQVHETHQQALDIMSKVKK